MSHYFFRYTFSLLFLSLLLNPSLCSAASRLNTNTNNIPTKISADHMNYEAEKNLIIFRGNVIVVRAEFNLWSDILYVYLKPSDTQDSSDGDPMAGMKSGDIDRLVAEHNVRMKYNTNTGTCKKAIYETGKALLTMYGDPILKDGASSVSGEEIRYYMNEDRSEVIGGKKRVEAFF